MFPLVIVCIIKLGADQPKWGFLPRSPFISEENAIKRRICRFCLYQVTAERRCANAIFLADGSQCKELQVQEWRDGGTKPLLPARSLFEQR